MLIEDNPLYVRLIKEMLATARHGSFDLEDTYRLSTGLARLVAGDIDVILLDLSLPDSRGYETFARVHDRAPQVPIIVLTNTDNEVLAAQTVSAGAQDYLVKSELGATLLARVIRYAVERQRMITALVEQHTRRWKFSESRFRTILESTADGILIVDRNGLVRFVNPAAEVLLQRTGDELVGEPFGFHAVAGATAELDLRRKDGKPAVIEMRVSETEWDGEHVLLASLRDVTERKLAGEEIKIRSEQQAIVARLGQLALAQPDLLGLFREAVKLIADICKVEYCQVVEFLPDNRVLTVRAAVGGEDGDDSQVSIELETNSLAGFTLSAGGPVIVEDLPTETRFRDTWLHGRGVISGMSVVIHGQDRPFGVLAAQTVKNRQFTQDDLNFLQTVANVLAAAVGRTRAENQLKASLQEKVVLLREVHHRVKNNLQAISNLLYLQSNYIQDETVREKFQETQDRVKSIALIHEKLYQSKDLAHLDFAEYIESLATHLVSSYKINPGTVKLNIDVEDIPIDVDTAIPLGIIITELVANALKYAFPPAERTNDGADRVGEIKIQVCRNAAQQLVLTVSDNGVGIPASLDVATSKSLGLELIHLLSNHMRGTVNLDRHNGTTFTITIPPMSANEPK